MADEKATKKEDAARTGSTPRTDPEAHLVDTSGGAQPVTAGALRKAGYGVPDGVKDDEVPGAYSADSPRTDPEPHLVQDFTPEHMILTDKTPAEHAASQPAAKGEATSATTLTTTPAKQAVKDSKGSDAEKKGPRPKVETLSTTPAQAAGTPDPEA